MAETISAPILVDQDEIAQLAYDDLATSTPGWLPSDGNPTARLIQAVASIVAYWATLTGNVPTDIVLWIGRFMLGVPPIAASYATYTSTWVLADTAGYTIAAGTNVGVPDVDGNLIGLTVRDDVIVAPGSSTTGAGEVVLVASESGTGSNSLTGAVTLVDNLAFVSTIVLVAPVTSGAAAETVDEYLLRYGDIAPLVGKISLALPEDVERYSRIFGPGVRRAKAVRGYNPDDNTTGNAKTIGVALIDAAGLALSSPVKTELRAEMEALREVGQIIGPFDATYTTISIGFAGVALAGYDPPIVQAATVTAATSTVNPAVFALPQEGDQRLWLDGQDKVRFQDVVTALNTVVGFDHYTSLVMGVARSVTAVASTDVFTATGHGYANGDPVAFTLLTGGAGVVVGTTYFVRDVTTNTFKVAATVGGAAINITTDLTAGTMYAQGTADITLTGTVGLPLPGTISGTVTAP